MNISTQTDFICSPGLEVRKKETVSQGNQTSVSLTDASVNTCSEPDPPSEICSPLPSTEITKITDGAQSPTADTEDLNKQLSVNQNLKPASCRTDNYTNKQYTGITARSIGWSSLRDPYRYQHTEYRINLPDVSREKKTAHHRVIWLKGATSDFRKISEGIGEK